MDKNLSWKQLLLLVFMVFLPQLLKLTLTSNVGYIMQILVMLLLYMYWASSWNIIGGYGGLLSLGHASYIGIGAYTSTICAMYLSISPWVGMLIGGLLAGFVSLIIGYPTFRLKGSYFALSTVALLNVMRIVFLSEDTIFGFKTFAAMGIKIKWLGGHFIDMQSLDKTFYYYIILGLLVIMVLVSNFMATRKTGYYLAAIRTNQEAADSLGVNVQYYKLKAQFISAFFTAIGGTIYAQLISFIEPQRIFGYDLSVEIALMAIIGGRGTVWGPIVGALILYPAGELLRSSIGSKLPGSSVAIYGLLLMVIIYFMPQGLLHYYRVLSERLFKGKHAPVADALNGGGKNA